MIQTREPFEERVRIVRERRSPHGHMIGLRIGECAPGECRTTVPYHPVFAGDAATGVLHGGLVTTLLDESCGAATQLALEDTTAIATLDLRIDYMRPAAPGKDLHAHATCYKLTRSIAFVRALAYQESEADPIASASAAFMIGANRSNMMSAAPPKVSYDMMPSLDETPPPGAGEIARMPWARFLGMEVRQDGTTVMPYDVRLTGNPLLPALHGGTIGAFLETTAMVGVTREIGPDVSPKPIGLTVNYLRSGRPLDTFGRVRIVKQGRRVVAFEAQAWQTSPASPIASAYGHFMLRRDVGGDEG